jgi:hypothetical protein
MMAISARLARGVIPLVILVLGAGCATAGPAQRLAERTSGNISLLNTQLDLLAQDSRRLAEVRAANIGRLQADISDVRLRYLIDIEILQRIGEASKIEQAKGIREFIEKLAKLRQEATKAAREREARVIARYQALVVPAQQLNQLASELAVLGREEDLKTRSAFLLAFVQSVASEVKTQQKAKEQSVDKAKAEVDVNAKKDPAGKKDPEK